MSTTLERIKFCTGSDGVRIAYAVSGVGLPLVKAAHWLTHIEFDPASPVWRHWLALLQRQNTLVRYDARGCGLSDWDVDEISFEGWVRDLETVVDAAGLERFPLIGLSQAGAVCVAYAARHPERVSHLVLCGAFARGRAHWASDRSEEFELAIRLAEMAWDRENPAFRQTFATEMLPDGTAEQLRAFTDTMRMSTSARNAGRILREVARLDVRDAARAVACPTLVFHSRHDARVPFEEGRALAALISGARFAPLNGRNHVLLENEPAWEIFSDEFESFLPQPTPTLPKVPFKDLSPRETDVLELIARGLDNAQIAAQLSLAEKTVRNHITSVFAKLGVAHRAQAVILARDGGLGRRT